MSMHRLRLLSLTSRRRIAPLSPRASSNYSIRGPTRSGATTSKKLRTTAHALPTATREARHDRASPFWPACHRAGDEDGEQRVMTGIPFMITQAQKDALRARGLTDADILNITPGRAQEILTTTDTREVREF